MVMPVAKKGQGWVKLHRKIEDDELWTDKEPFDKRSAWIDLIMMANHEDRTILVNGNPVVIGEGQRWTSVRTLAARWHWSEGRVRRYLKLLEKLKKVTQEKSKNGTLLTIEKYSFYQHGRLTDEHTDRHTDELTDGSPIDTKQELLRTIYNKNDKEVGAKPLNPDSLEGYE